MNKEMFYEFKNELKKNTNFKARIGIISYRIGFIATYKVNNYLFKRLILISYYFLKVICDIFSCGNLPHRKSYIDWGLRIPHGFLGIVVSEYAKIGKNCTLFHNTTIGVLENETYNQGDIYIGNNVYIGSNCLILGKVNIEDNCNIGAGTILIGKNIEKNSTVVNQIIYKITKR